RPRHIFVDLPEDRGLEVGGMHLRARSGRRRESDLLGERELGAGKNANCRRRVFGRGKPTRTGPEIARRQLVADSCSTRLNMVQAVVAHAEELLIGPPNAPIFSSKDGASVIKSPRFGPI